MTEEPAELTLLSILRLRADGLARHGRLLIYRGCAGVLSGSSLKSHWQGRISDGIFFFAFFPLRLVPPGAARLLGVVPTVLARNG